MKILMLQKYKEYKDGERYDLEDWTAQQIIETGRAIAVKDMQREDVVAKNRSVRPRKVMWDRPL